MKLKRNRSKGGFALLMVLAFVAVALIGLGGALSWTSTTALNTDRNNQYFTTVAAAEAATEKVLTKMSGDFQVNGIGSVITGLPSYRGLTPDGNEEPFWNGFQFSDGEGTANSTYVQQIGNWGYTNLGSQYAGLKGYAATFRVVSNARSTVPPVLTAAVKQEIQLAAIPVFQFAIFYTMDLEINPGPDMTINGRVHSNGEIYTRPNSSVTYLDHVTAVRNINLFQSPLDPSGRPTTGVVQFKKEHDARVSSLTLPIGTNNSPQAVHSVVDVPPPGEAIQSLMGKQRYFNKADVVLIYSNATMVARSGSFNGFSTTIPTNQLNTFLSTNTSFAFYNMREGKTVRTMQIDVAAFKIFSEGWFHAQFGRRANTIYIADKRNLTGSSQSGIRVVNGHTLPVGGLTVATPNPLYLKGHYNSPPSPNHRGTANTSNTRPASLVADAITILSQNWNDANGNSPLGHRLAVDTTVNAAFLGGIVPSNGTYYSGGVENFPRFLENWSGRTLTYNGSMVVMFYSQIANGPWTGTGVSYHPPNRNWAFDLNFLDVTKLPPGTPQLLTMVRGTWGLLPPNTIL
ncbi:MAG TPA: hypothetical protein VF773_11000 [Verrucomicrobiae bacterium]